ncbi:MAG TPA: TusE/DsrC/DsvC family sulfur relay protein [Bacteroidales bacterium]|nr:TusE/DsrC/DsvC family sulfur relay protein [Bacteroidales bacterium]
MTSKTYAGTAVEMNEEGYFTNPLQWTPEIAKEVAKENNLELTEKHLAVLKFIRDKQLSGELITIRAIGKSGIVDIKGFYELFPGAPLKLASKIAGVAKPSSCV